MLMCCLTYIYLILAIITRAWCWFSQFFGPGSLRISILIYEEINFNWGK